jgi:hypothetical protein
MKGKLVKFNGDWVIQYFDAFSVSNIPLHPADKTSFLNEGSEVEFDIFDEEVMIEGKDRFARILIQHNF